MSIYLVKKYQTGVHEFTKQALENWSGFLKLSIPSMFMSLVEGSAFEMLSIYSGMIGVIQLGSTVIMANVSFLFYMVPLGIGIATSADMGKELGAGNYKNSAMMFRAVYALS